MSKFAYLYRSRLSTSNMRRMFLWATIWQFLIFALIIGVAWVVIPNSFTSPINGFIASVGGATLVILSINWTRRILLFQQKITFVYGDHAKVRTRLHAGQIFKFPESPEFTVFWLGIRPGAFLRVTGKGSTTWVFVPESKTLGIALEKIGRKVRTDRLTMPTAFFTFVATLIYLQLTNSGALFPFILVVALAAWRTGILNKGEVHTSKFPAQRRSAQVSVIGYAFTLIASMWSILMAMTLPFSDIDQKYLGIQARIRAGHYEESIPKLISFAEQSDSARHLNWAAWVLATIPNPAFRNFEKAKEFAERSLSRDLTSAAEDTLSCALFGKGEKEKAIATAEKAGLPNRIQEFQKGKLCEDTQLFPAERGLASAAKPTASVPAEATPKN